MDLLSLVLSLHPIERPAPERAIPQWWGRATHALLLDVIRQADENLAAQLHDNESGPRPFTVSNLIGPSTRDGLKTENAYRLRFTACQADVANLLRLAAQPGGPLAAGKSIELDYFPFTIESTFPSIDQQSPNPPILQSKNPPIQESENPYIAATTYQELSAPYLLAQVTAPRRLVLSFTSPTTFKSGGMHVPVPLPSLVFGSLLEKWNAFAPVAFPPETKRYAEECLAISQYKLSTRRVEQKSGGLRMGAVGEIAYATLNYDRYWMSVIATLAAFARFSGVGAGTSQGLGQCRVVVTSQ